MDLDTIMAAIDFSDESECALAHAKALAARRDAELLLAHASALPTEHAETAATATYAHIANSFARLAESELAQRREQLDELREQVAGEGIRTHSLLVPDDPAHGLPDAARDRNIDLIVVGTHGHTGLRRWLLGSVAESTVRLSDAHVLVARSAPSPGRYHRLIVATDFGEASVRALRLGVALAAPDARIDVLHAWQLPPMAYGGITPPSAVMIDGLERSARTQAERWTRQHAPEGAEVELHCVQQAPVDAIRDRAIASGADLIAIGSHGRRGIKRWLLGSTAEATVRHAPCSVAVAHGPHDGAEEADDEAA